MKIFIVCPYGIDNPGGVWNHVFNLTQQLKKKKIKLDLRSIFLQGLLLRNKNYPRIFENNKYLHTIDIKNNKFITLN